MIEADILFFSWEINMQFLKYTNYKYWIKSLYFIIYVKNIAVDLLLTSIYSSNEMVYTNLLLTKFDI